MGQREGSKASAEATEFAGLSRDERRDYLVGCAREVMERCGIEHASLAEVARRAGIRRELVYYYFDGKDDLVAAVVDSYVTDFVDSVMLWNEQLEAGVGHFEDFVPIFWRMLYNKEGRRRPMRQVLGDAGLLDEFIREVVNRCIAYLRTTIFYRRCCEANGGQPAEMAVEFVLLGTLGVLVGDPDADQTRLANIAWGALQFGVSDNMVPWFSNKYRAEGGADAGDNG